MANPTPPAAPGPQTYQHLDFQPPKDVIAAHKDGMARCDAGECKGHATPDMMAMCKHLAALKACRSLPTGRPRMRKGAQLAVSPFFRTCGTTGLSKVLCPVLKKALMWSPCEAFNG